MTIGTFLTSSVKRLQHAGVDSARLDCLILLEDVLGQNRAHILAHPEQEISDSIEKKMNKKIEQREKSIPLAYIRGRAAFYGRTFLVNSDVLVPRPETETMIELVKSLQLPPKTTFADIGTGSGCIGITIALEIPNSIVHLYDISPSALAVATKNSLQHSVSTPLFRATNLLQDLKQSYDVLLANLPYVPKNFPINAAARYEPGIALFGGDDGLDLYRTFWAQVAQLPIKPRHILTESFTIQHSPITILAAQAGYRAVKTNGLIQQFNLLAPLRA